MMGKGTSGLGGGRLGEVCSLGNFGSISSSRSPAQASETGCGCGVGGRLGLGHYQQPSFLQYLECKLLNVIETNAKSDCGGMETKLAPTQWLSKYVVYSH